MEFAKHPAELHKFNMLVEPFSDLVRAVHIADYQIEDGIGVFLSNGAVVVHFNDFTTMYLSADHMNYWYLESEAGQKSRVVASGSAALGTISEEYHIKFNLLLKFQHYLVHSYANRIRENYVFTMHKDGSMTTLTTDQLNFNALLDQYGYDKDDSIFTWPRFDSEPPYSFPIATTLDLDQIATMVTASPRCSFDERSSVTTETNAERGGWQQRVEEPRFGSSRKCLNLDDVIGYRFHDSMIQAVFPDGNEILIYQTDSSPKEGIVMSISTKGNWDIYSLWDVLFQSEHGPLESLASRVELCLKNCSSLGSSFSDVPKDSLEVHQSHNVVFT